MTDDNDTDDTHVEGSTNYTPPSYAIDPADMDIANAILSQDPATLPGTGTVSKGFKFPPITSTDALPPHLRDAARAKMGANVSERDAIIAVLRENAVEFRSKTGFAPTVDPFFHELANVTREFNDMLAEYNRMSDEIAASVTYEKDEDGNPKAVIGLSAARQRAIKIRQQSLEHRMDLLSKDGEHGIEAQRRLDKALHESVERRKAQAAQQAEHREVDARARQIARDERVEAKAKALSSRYRDTP
jgi:hypothetical protein